MNQRVSFSFLTQASSSFPGRKNPCKESPEARSGQWQCERVSDRWGKPLRSHKEKYDYGERLPALQVHPELRGADEISSDSA